MDARRLMAALATGAALVATAGAIAPTTAAASAQDAGRDVGQGAGQDSGPDGAKDDRPKRPFDEFDELVWKKGREETAGPWRAWIETSSDRSRRARAFGHVFRVNGEGPPGVPTAVGTGWQGDVFDLRVHPDGWVAAQLGSHVYVVGPDGAKGEPRLDLRVTPASRFTERGFLSVAAMGGSGMRPSVRIAWAPLGKDGLGKSVELALVETARHREAVAEAALSWRDEAGRTRVWWSVPSERGLVHGAASIDRATGAVTSEAAPGTVRVAAVQMPSVLGGTDANLAVIRDGVARAARAGAEFVVLPETCVQGYLSQDLSTVWHAPCRPRDEAFREGVDPRDASLVPTDPPLRALAQLAADWGVWLTIPFLERGVGPPELPELRVADLYWNSVLLAGPDGRIRAHYRKLRPWQHPEKSWAAAGDLGTVTAETPFGRVGLAICFDVHEVFPMYAALERKPWAMLYPIAWVSGGDDAEWFGKELPRRAAEHGFHVVGANWSTDRPQPWHGAGWSSVISAKGEVLAQSVRTTGLDVVVADLPVAAPPPK